MHKRSSLLFKNSGKVKALFKHLQVLPGLHLPIQQADYSIMIRQYEKLI